MEEEGALDAQSLISLSLRKIHSSRTQRGGLKLHKNLLVSYVLRNARQLYFSERYAEFYRRQQQQQQHLYPDSLGAGGHGGAPHWSLFANPIPSHSDEAHFQRCCALGRVGDVLGGPASCPSSAAPLEAPRLHIAGSAPEQKELLGAQVSPHSCAPSELDEALHFQRCCALGRVGDALGGPASCPSSAAPLEAPRLHMAGSAPGQKELLGAQAAPPSSAASVGFDPRMGSATLYAAPLAGSGFAPAFGAPPLGSGPSPPCSNRTTVLDLDTHVVTTVDNGFVHHQDCVCGSLGGCAPPPPPPPPLPVFPGAKRKYDEEDPRLGGGSPPAPSPPPPPSAPASPPGPKRARLDDAAAFPSHSQEPSSHISNLISIFGAGFTGLASRPPSPQCPQTSAAPPGSPSPPFAPPSPPPPPSPSPAIDAEQTTLNGQLCGKQALASLGAWTRAIVAF